VSATSQQHHLCTCMCSDPLHAKCHTTAQVMVQFFTLSRVTLENTTGSQNKYISSFLFKHFHSSLSIFTVIAFHQSLRQSVMQVLEDPEVQAWWAEVKSKGHPDVKTGWIDPKDIASLARILTIIAWTASAFHAAVNFNQYDYSAWMPNKPSFIRRPIPTSGDDLQVHPQASCTSNWPNSLL
jgi:hypothetical protein